MDNLSGYLVAGRRLKIGLGTSTLIATELGTVTIMYMGENGYHNGFAAMVVGVILLLAYLLVGRTGFIIEGLRKLRVMTIPEFYEFRYRRSVRIIGGVILFIGGVLNMGVFLKLDSVFLSHAMGFVDTSVAVIMVIMLVAVGLYTMFGGMLSVVFTDYMQFAVMSVGMLLATVFAFRAVSLPQIATAVSQNLGTDGFNPFSNPNLGWTFVFWMLLSNFAAAALYQPGVSRALSAENPNIGMRLFTIASLTFAGRAMIPMFLGVVALTLYPGLSGNAAMAAMPHREYVHRRRSLGHRVRTLLEEGEQCGSVRRAFHRRVRPAAFLVLTGVKSALPPWIAWLANPNYSGFASFALGALGLLVGSLLTQKISPPKDITPYLEKEN